MDKPNIYLTQVHDTLPRLLALYDIDPLSPTWGVGDRYHWAWKLIDFGNGTFQGAAHGLARLMVNSLLPNQMSEESVLRRIDAMFTAADHLRYPNGSLAEAFPNESSFCVTALVAFDLLSAVELLSHLLDDRKLRRYLAIVAPMISFLHKVEETHATISNHIATAAAAVFKWAALSGAQGEERGRQLLNRLIKEQSEEGWFREYEGMDPGYETLCLYYLADLNRLRPDLDLLEPIRKSIRFLWHFAHSDGSFGGYYGSRNTRIYFPAGIEAMSSQVPEAEVLAEFMRKSIYSGNTVTLKAMDEPNLTPMFNAYCYAAELFEKKKAKQTHRDIEPLPVMSGTNWRRKFKDAGLLIDRGEDHYTIISWHKGGVCYHFPRSGSHPVINVGVAVRTRNNKYYSSQAFSKDNQINIEGDSVVITAPLVEMKKRLPTPLQFIVLRLLNISLMRSIFLSNLVKKLLVRFLITGKNTSTVKTRRRIVLGSELSISDTLDGNTQGFNYMELEQPFSAIHMASQGYWQIQDDSGK